MSALTRLLGLAGPRPARAPAGEWLPGVPVSALHANCALVGMTGSGKSTLLKALIELLLARGDGLFVPLAKPDDHLWLRAAVGRSGRGCAWLAPGCPHTVNVFREAAVAGLDPASQASVDAGTLDAVTQAVQRHGGGQSQGDGGFWKAGADLVARMAFSLLRFAGATPTFALAQQVLADAAASPRALAAEHYKAGLVYRSGLQALRAHHGGRHEAAARRVVEYWVRTFPRVPPRQREGYLGHLRPALDAMTTGVAGELFNGESLDLRALVEGGGVLATDYSPATYGSLGVGVNAALKAVLQRVLLSRVVLPGSPTFYQLIDEYSQTASDGDAQFMALSRSARAPSVIAFQGVESLREVWPNNPGRADVILANTGVKIFTRLGPESAKYLSESLGTRLAFTFSGSSGGASYSTPESLWSGYDAGANASASWGQVQVPWLAPHELLQLKTGSDSDGKEVQAVVVPGGQGVPFRRVSIRRKG